LIQQLIYFKGMKKISGFILCIILFIGIDYTQAQIVLDNADLPMFNDVEVTSIVDSSMADTLSAGNSGGNITWDFNNLYFCCIDIKNYRWVNPLNTINASFFPEADIALKSHCYLYHNTTTHAVTEICDNRDYFTKDSSGLKYYGSDFPYPHKTNTYRNVFPILSYGQSKTNNFRIAYQSSPNSVFVRNVIDTMNADAWGTLITVFGTYSVIRIYTKEIVRDSLYINGSGQLINYMPDNYYYKWYTKGLGFPVLQISKGVLESSPDYRIVRAARYKWQETYITEVPKSDFTSSVFPNPISSTSVLSFFINKKSKLNIILSNIIGQQLASYSENFNMGNHNLLLTEIMDSSLSSGIYFLSVNIEDEQKIIKLIKE